MFNLQQTIVLYDLTNTYFEGRALNNNQAKFGRSKEKRTDCPLVTLGLVLDGEGFPCHSDVFEGNASESKTLQDMIKKLNHTGSSNPIIVMDAGIASEENIYWLKEHAYRYIVVSRKRSKLRPDEKGGAVIVKNLNGQKVIAQKIESLDSDEIMLYCHSQLKEKKELGMKTQAQQRFEEALMSLNGGLTKKGCTKKYEKVIEKIGRLKQSSASVSGLYDIIPVADEEKKTVIKIEWKRSNKDDEKNEQAGVYCLRTNILDWSEVKIWETYIMLNEIESTFKSMKSELGLRPIHHQKEKRVSAHLFITLLAYHVVHTIRYQLKQKGITSSWTRIRHIMGTQQRMTVSMSLENGDKLFIRSTSKPETAQKEIIDALGIKLPFLPAKKTHIKSKN